MYITTITSQAYNPDNSNEKNVIAKKESLFIIAENKVLLLNPFQYAYSELTIIEYTETAYWTRGQKMEYLPFFFQFQTSSGRKNTVRIALIIEIIPICKIPTPRDVLELIINISKFQTQSTDIPILLFFL